jgi:O-antigen ligase
MAAFLLLAVGSTIWSEHPGLTLRRSMHLGINATSLVLIGLTFRHESENLLKRLFYIFGAITLANAAALISPSTSFSPIGFMGIHNNKNDAGGFLFCAIPLFMMGILDRTISNRRWLAIMLFVVGVGLLALTESKTAWVCILVVIPMAIAIRSAIKSKRFGRGVLPLVYALFALAVLFVVLDFGIASILDRIFGEATLTGRSDIWKFALTKFDSSPVNGIGYGALWQTGYDIGRYLFLYKVTTVNEAHNGYIDILAQLGLLGLISLAYFLVVVFYRVCRVIRDYEDQSRIGIPTYALFLMIGIMIYNITESLFFGPGLSQWVLLVLVSSCVMGRMTGYSIMYKTRGRLPRAKLNDSSAQSFAARARR